MTFGTLQIKVYFGLTTCVQRASAIRPSSMSPSGSDTPPAIQKIISWKATRMPSLARPRAASRGLSCRGASQSRCANGPAATAPAPVRADREVAAFSVATMPFASPSPWMAWQSSRTRWAPRR
jgi:hypothetical protein